MSVADSCRGPCLYVCLCVSCLGATSECLTHIDNLTKLEILILRGAPASLTSGQEGQKGPGRWFLNLPSPLRLMVITGELQRHIDAKDFSTEWTVLYYIC